MVSFHIPSPCPVLGRGPGPKPGPGPSPGPNLIPVLGSGPVIFLVPALAPVKFFGPVTQCLWIGCWSHFSKFCLVSTLLKSFMFFLCFCILKNLKKNKIIMELIFDALNRFQLPVSWPERAASCGFHFKLPFSD